MLKPDRASQLNIGPNRARYNDWRELNMPTPDTSVPTLPVSVIVPYFEAPEELARTLAALEKQTYPRRLFEVVVVDDGSEPPLSPPPSTLDVRVVLQEDPGFGRARARNAGASEAAGCILVFLDCDVLPEAEFLAAHARWHHVVSDALTVGRCAYVDVDGIDPAAIRNRTGSLKELFSGRTIDPPWSEGHIRRTNGMTDTDDAPFNVVVSGNLGISKAFYESVGGFDESFIRYGCEDTEFGYRAYACGALLVPDEKTSAWHQGRWQQNLTADKNRDAELQRGKLAHFVPHRLLRAPAPGRIFTVPRHVVTIRAAGQPGRVIDEDVKAILADPAGDLAVRIELAAESCLYRTLWLQERYGPDPRVSIAAENTALDDFPSAAFHISVPAGVRERGVVQRLRAALGAAVEARMATSGAGGAMITRTWALHRSRRTGLPVEHFGDIVEIPPDDPASPPDASPPNAGERSGAFLRMLRKARFPRQLTPRR